MKRCFAILFTFLLLNFCFAQEFEVHFTDSIAYGQPGSFFHVEGHITNLSTTNTLTVKMVRVQNNLPSANWISSLCFGGCYPSHVDSIGCNIQPDSSEMFSVDFNTDSIPGTASVVIKFATRNNSQVETQWFIGSTIANDIPEDNQQRVTGLYLNSNYPNPFNNQTIISAILDAPGKVKLQIYDILGREIYSAVAHASNVGRVEFRWNGISNEGIELSSGIYFYRVSQSTKNVLQQSEVKKLTLLR